MPADLAQITLFTIGAALAATLIMLPPGVALAWLLARHQFRGKAIVDTIASLPLVMPPVATGLILLDLFGMRGPFGPLLRQWNLDVVFTRKGVVLAMVVMGLPLLVRTARTGFEQVRPRYEHLAATLGAGPWRIFFTITLPLAGRAVLAGALLGFSRAIGEFGATVLVAGNIPGRTRTLALAIYSETEAGHDDRAAHLLLISVVIAFAAVAVSNALVHRPPDDART
jgi:molybdate transport system permease protein